MGSKKDKKDRKQKTEKKSKKDKKSSKKSGKDRKHKNEHEGSSNDESGLATILNTALFGNPKLMVDIPAIAKSLDDGEYVDVYSISHPFTRGVLGQLMKHLPVLYDAQNGYYKDSINTNVSEFIVRHLTKLQIIKEPRDLSMSESLASKNVVQKLLELLTTFPDLKDELGGLFATIIDGNAVQLESLDNEDIRDGLEDLFRAIGMENSAEGYALPEGRRSELVKEALEHLSGAFESYASSVAAQQSSEKGRKNSKKDETHSSSSSSESESGSDSSHSEAEHEAEDHQTNKLIHASAAPATADEPSSLIGPAGPPEAPSEISEPTGPIKGPSMPTLKDLHAARALIEQQRRSGVHHTGEGEESSDDDGYGPQLCDTATARVLQAQMSAVPLGFTGVEVDAAFERAFEAENAGINSRLRGEIYTGEAHKIEDENKREEWILNPGDSKLAASLSGAGLTNRKFQAGKGAKKAAEQMSIQREFQRQQQALQNAQAAAQQGEGFVSTDAVMQDYREKRGESLMEQHLAKKARTGSTEHTTAVGVGGKQQRRAFDHERDMGSQSKLNEDKVSKLVQNAKELDDRFDKGSVQKSFL